MLTHVAPVRSVIGVLLIASCLGLPFPANARAGRKPPTAPDDLVDISASRDKLRAFTDGKGHYMVLIPFEYSGPAFFYGDGKHFFAQRGFGGGHNGEESFNRSFWEPRVENRGQSMFQYLNKKYSLTCGQRETSFTPLADQEGAAMIAAAKFHRPQWKRQSYWLGRDEKGRYYFLDRMREPQGNTNFRLFIGPKGNLKPEKMTKIVSNAKGDVFTTRGGELRVLPGSSESAWRHGKERIALTAVPIEDNHVLVYTDLGVYRGERLGTPCDDL